MIPIDMKRLLSLVVVRKKAAVLLHLIWNDQESIYKTRPSYYEFLIRLWLPSILKPVLQPLPTPHIIRNQTFIFWQVFIFINFGWNKMLETPENQNLNLQHIETFQMTIIGKSKWLVQNIVHI